MADREGSKRSKADALFSRLVRQRDGACRRCLKVVPFDLLQAHHFIKRRYRNTRYDFANAVALCWDCHEWCESHPVLADWFAVSIIGEEKFHELYARAHDMTRLVDLDHVLDELKGMAA